MNYVSGKLGGKRSKTSAPREIMKNHCSFWGSPATIPTLTGIITALCLSGNGSSFPGGTLAASEFSRRFLSCSWLSAHRLSTAIKNSSIFGSALVMNFCECSQSCEEGLWVGRSCQHRAATSYGAALWFHPSRGSSSPRSKVTSLDRPLPRPEA